MMEEQLLTSSVEFCADWIRSGSDVRSLAVSPDADVRKKVAEVLGRVLEYDHNKPLLELLRSMCNDSVIAVRCVVALALPARDRYLAQMRLDTSTQVRVRVYQRWPELLTEAALCDASQAPSA